MDSTLFLAASIDGQAFHLSLGVVLGSPMGDFADVATLLYGPTVGGELPVGDNIGITFQAGYLLASLNSDVSDVIDSYNFIPLQGGIKYYFMEQQEGFYAHGQLEVHSGSVKTKDIDFGPLGKIEGSTGSSSSFSWAIGAGYEMEKLDIGLR